MAPQIGGEATWYVLFLLLDDNYPPIDSRNRTRTSKQQIGRLQTLDTVQSWQFEILRCMKLTRSRGRTEPLTTTSPPRRPTIAASWFSPLIRCLCYRRANPVVLLVLGTSSRPKSASECLSKSKNSILLLPSLLLPLPSLLLPFVTIGSQRGSS